jgi:dihydrofolate reductase
MLPLSDRLLVTEVDLDIADADAFFPAFDESDWLELTRRPLTGGAEGTPAATYRELVRRR